MYPLKQESRAGGRGNPKSDLPGGSISSEFSTKPLNQQQAWQLAMHVFGSELPSPRREICGTSADGIRYWRVAR